MGSETRAQSRDLSGTSEVPWVVATEPVLVDSKLVDGVRRVVGDDISAFIESAIARALRDRELTLLLDEVEGDVGRPTDELLAEAESFWRAG